MQTFMKQVQNSLAQNEKLNEEAKQNLLLLVKEMYRQMTLPRELLVERLKTVSFEEGAKFINREAYHYNIEENSICFQIDQIGDQKNVLCQALLEMAIIKESGKGLDDQSLYSIKKGALEIYANYLVGNDSEFGISEDEQIITNLMNILTENQILVATLKDDGELLKNILFKHKLAIINDYANYNAVHRQNGGLSQLNEIEKSLIYHFFALPKEEMEKKRKIEKIGRYEKDFRANIVSCPNVMKNPKKYFGLTKLDAYYEQQSIEYNIINSTVNTDVITIPTATQFVEMDDSEDYKRRAI